MLSHAEIVGNKEEETMTEIAKESLLETKEL